MKTRKITLGLILLSFVSLSAQPRLSLKDCMEYALQHSSKIEIQQADYDDALLQRRDAILRAFTPSISAGTNAYTNFGRTIDPETNSYISMTSFSNSYSVNASILLFNGFTALNNLKIAKTAVKMGASRKQQLHDEICLSVMQAYFNVLFESDMKNVLTAQVATAQQNLLLMTKQYELGQKGYAEVAQLEADLAEREYQLIAADNKVKEALLDLKAIMLWTVQDTLAIDTVLASSLSSALPTNHLENVSELTAFAQTYQPTALLAKGKMENARYALRSARGQFLPTLSLSGGWSTSYYTYPDKKDYEAPSFTKQFRNNGGEYVQLSLSFPIYDRLSTSSNLRRKKNDYQRATAAYRQTLKDIENEVARALQDSKGAWAAYQQAEKRLKAQEEAYRLTEKKLAQGLISPIAYQTVSNVYLNAKAERLNALLQYRLKQSVVQFYKGISYLEQQQ